MNSTENLVQTTFESSQSNGSQPLVSNMSYDYADVFILVGDIYFYGLAIIFPFGFVGNFFSICVFLFSTKLRRTTSGLWLIALGLADSVVLFGEMTRWFSFRRHFVHPYYYIPKLWELNFYNCSYSACRIITMLRYASNFWSSWFTVAISAERLVVVARPLEAKMILTLRRTTAVIVCVVLVGLGFSLFPLWTLELRMEYGFSYCRKIKGSEHDILTNVFVNVLGLFLPCIALIVLTSAIIVFLYRARAVRRSQLRSPAATATQETTSCLPMEAQMTMTLLSICITTICLRTPYIVAYSVRNYDVRHLQLNEEPVDRIWNMHTYVALCVTSVFNVLNFTINFLLCCFCGRYFRQEAKKLLCPWRKDGILKRCKRKINETEDIVL